MERDLFSDDDQPAGDGPPAGDTPAERAARFQAELETLFEYSVRAYDTACQAGMSELPVERDIRLYIRKVLAAAKEAETSAPRKLPAPATKAVVQLAAREAADRAASDRGESAVRAVLAAAFKVNKEIERMMGMLRFSPRDDGLYLARCAPDHFVLPALAEHFYRRFGETPWAIADEKRGLVLIRRAGEEPRIEPSVMGAEGGKDPWEDLWRTYHQSINIENRKNPELQKRFMPARYWKYLTEKGV
jgi:probable DNA metabolism protein